MRETGNGGRIARVLARIMVVVIVLAVNVVCVMAVFSLVESGTTTPDIYVVSFRYADNRDGETYVSVAGTVANPSSLAANNVTVVIRVYVKYLTPPLNTSVLDLGVIAGNSSKSFNTDIPYSSGWSFDGADYDLLLGSRFDFGIGFFAIALAMAFLLPTLDIYSAYRLGLFGWIRARKKAVAVTVAWSVIIALVIIKSYWLFYSNPGSGSWESPQLYVWDWLAVFFLSVVVGAYLADLEAIVYGFIASLVLSLAFEVIYASFFTWFSMGVGNSFSMIIPGLTFATFLESTIGIVLLDLLRMENIIIPVFCLLGVMIGVFIRSYVEPSVDAF